MSNRKTGPKVIIDSFLNLRNAGNELLKSTLKEMHSIFGSKIVFGLIKTKSFIIFDEFGGIILGEEVIDWRRVLREAYDANLEYIAKNISDYRACSYEFNAETFVVQINGNIQGFIGVIKDNDNELPAEKLKEANDLCKKLAKSFPAKSFIKNATIDHGSHIYDALDIAFSVIEAATGKIIYMNEKAMLSFSESDMNKNCWEILRCNQTERCEGCIIDNISVPEGLESVTILSDQTVGCKTMHSMIVKPTAAPHFLYELMFDTKTANILDIKLNYLNECDYLSGFPNRNKLKKDLTKKLQSDSNHFALMMVNINSFRFVNEAMGREQGDLFLLAVLEFFYTIDYLREKTYHLGGDEFAFILNNLDDARDAAAIIRDRFRDVWCVGNFESYCTISMGITIYPKDAGTADALINNAEIAMQSAKTKGSQEVVFFRKNEDKKVYHRLRKELMLKSALFKEVEQFQVFFHPLINTLNGKWIGAEALARWCHPTDGLISPAEFIPMAENLGLITELGELILQKACTECRRWHDEGYPEMVINVNLSVYQLYKKNYAERLKKIILDSGLDPSSVTFEITENIAMNDLKKTISCLNEIRELGSSISLDDFGKGYSSLNNLKSLPLDHVKIDRSFINEIHKGDYHYFFTKTIIELAHSINLQVYTEGIERREQWDILKKLQSDVLQGYYFGKPMLGEDFIKKLRMKR